MDQKFERVRDPNGKSTVSGLYRREYGTANGEASCLYYGRLKRRSDGKRIMFALGGNLTEAKDQWSIIQVKNRRGEELAEFKPEKKQPETGAKPMTVENWSSTYLEMEETKNKRSYAREQQLVSSVNQILGPIALTDLKREQLFHYRTQRLKAHIIRNGEPAKSTVKLGTVANELSCLRHMLNKARECEVATSMPSFAKLIVRSQRERVLTPDEQTALLKVYPMWMRRVAEVANETSLSEGDIIRLTKPMINRLDREIVPADGRVKTKVRQRAPLTDRVLEILDEIERDKRSGKIVANVNGLLFTREDGRAITKDMITGAIKVARKRAKVENFRFHDYRHCAKTEWARRGVQVDHAMLASGHKSVAMHQRYVNLQAGDVGKAFGLKMVNTDGKHEAPAKIKTRVSA